MATSGFVRKRETPPPRASSEAVSPSIYYYYFFLNRTIPGSVECKSVAVGANALRPSFFFISITSPGEENVRKSRKPRQESWWCVLASSDADNNREFFFLGPSSERVGDTLPIISTRGSRGGWASVIIYKKKKNTSGKRGSAWVDKMLRHPHQRIARSVFRTPRRRRFGIFFCDCSLVRCSSWQRYWMFLITYRAEFHRVLLS